MLAFSSSVGTRTSSTTKPFAGASSGCTGHVRTRESRRCQHRERRTPATIWYGLSQLSLLSSRFQPQARFLTAVLPRRRRRLDDLYEADRCQHDPRERPAPRAVLPRTGWEPSTGRPSPAGSPPTSTGSSNRRSSCASSVADLVRQALRHVVDPVVVPFEAARLVDHGPPWRLTFRASAPAPGRPEAVDVQVVRFLPLHISPVQAFVLLIAVIGLVGWAHAPARLVRGIVLSAKERGYVTASWGFGASDFYLLRRHILPQTRGVLLTQAALLIPQYILAEVTLSFLGLGVGEPYPSWGSMLANLQQYHVLVSYWWMFFPGLALIPIFVSYGGCRVPCRKSGVRQKDEPKECDHDSQKGSPACVLGGRVSLHHCWRLRRRSRS